MSWYGDAWNWVKDQASDAVDSIRGRDKGNEQQLKGYRDQLWQQFQAQQAAQTGVAGGIGDLRERQLGVLDQYNRAGLDQATARMMGQAAAARGSQVGLAQRNAMNAASDMYARYRAAGQEGMMSGLTNMRQQQQGLESQYQANLLAALGLGQQQQQINAQANGQLINAGASVLGAYLASGK